LPSSIRRIVINDENVDVDLQSENRRQDRFGIFPFVVSWNDYYRASENEWEIQGWLP
jgi:hypothetical protein